MIALAKLKKDLSFNQDLTKVIEVMKSIAAAKFYILERQLRVFEASFHAAARFLGSVDLSQIASPFVQGGTPTGVIMVTTDEGFLGGLNNQVVTAGLRQGGPTGVYMLIGERGGVYMQETRRSYTTFPGVNELRRGALAMEVRNHAVEQMVQGKFKQLVIVYPRPVSFAVQHVTTEVLLPCTAWVEPSGPHRVGMLWESSPEGVLEYVLAQWMVARLDLIFAWSRIAEMGARAVHLEGSFQELQRRGKKLKSDYFRSRHEVIDRSMREIFSAQLLYRRLEDEIAAKQAGTR